MDTEPFVELIVAAYIWIPCDVLPAPTVPWTVTLPLPPALIAGPSRRLTPILLLPDVPLTFPVTLTGPPDEVITPPLPPKFVPARFTPLWVLTFVPASPITVTEPMPPAEMVPST